MSGVPSERFARLLLAVITAPVAFVLGAGILGKAGAAPMTLTFESTAAGQVSLGTLASRSQCGVMTKQGVGPYTMSGTDARSGLPYSYVTDRNNSGAQMNESGLATPSMSYSRTTGVTYSGKTGVVQLYSNGSVTWSNSCSGRSVYGSAFGPEVYTQAFQATAGQALSFNWAAAGGSDDYEVYAFLVAVSPAGAGYDYGGSGATLLANTTLLAHGRGLSQAWKTSTGTIPADGYYRFRFVNGSYDASGGKALGANMYIDPNVLVGQANNISFDLLSDRVTSASNQTFTVSASATSGGTIAFSSSTTGKCTVGGSTDSAGVSTATVTLLANQTGLCTISANSAATGDYATAATVTRSFTLLAAPTAPTNSGGTSVSGSATVGSTLSAVEGSWADGGSAVTGTSFQWQVCPNPSSCAWSNVVGAATSSYLVGSSDVGKQFRVVVTKSNGIGSTSVNSSASATVAKGTQAVLTISTTSTTYGQPLSLATTGGSGSGAVTFAYVSGTCVLNGGTLTPGDVGSSCVLTATKAADASYNSATSSNTSITVQKANQPTLSVSSTSGTMGVSLSLTASGGSGTGSISWTKVSGACTISGSTLTPTAAGTSCVVRATRASDSNYNSADSSDTVITIAKGTQSALAVTSTAATYGQQLNLTSSGGSGTGAVSWTKVSGTCTLSNGSVMPGDAGSSCVVRATRAGDTNFNPRNSSDTAITTAKAPQSGFSVTSASSFTTGGTLSLTTTGGQSSGSVSWSLVSGQCTLSGSSLAAGRGGITCVVEATRSGDSNYLSASDSANITVNKITQVITFRSAAPSPATVGSTYTVSVDSDAFLAPTIAVANGSSSVCSVAAGVVSFNSTGTCLISASQAGNDTYTSAAASQSVSVVAALAAAAPTNTAPAISTPLAPVVSPSSTAVAVPVATTTTTTTTTTVPATPGAPATTVPATTTTSTTTTTVPADPTKPQTGLGGALSELAAGETTAVVRGEIVKVTVEQVEDTLVVTLPNDVKIVFGRSSRGSTSVGVAADGVLRMFREEEVEIRVSGLVPGTVYTVYMFSEPFELGRGVADGSGVVATLVKVPSDAAHGEHTIQVNGVGPDGEMVTTSMGFEVLKRQDNTRVTVLAIGLGILLALLGGRPVFAGRRRRRV